MEDGRRLPTYDGTDHYVLNGEELVPQLVQRDGGWQPRAEEREGYIVQYYRLRVGTQPYRSTA